MLATIVAFTILGNGFGAMNATGPNESHGVAPCEIKTAVRGEKGNVLYYTCKY